MSSVAGDPVAIGFDVLAMGEGKIRQIVGFPGAKDVA
jgi:hypothetical protein